MDLKEVDIEEIEVNKQTARDARRTSNPFGDDDTTRYDAVGELSGGNDTGRSGKGFLILGVILCLVSLTLFAVTYLLYRHVKLEEDRTETVTETEITYTQAEVDSMVKEAVEEAETDTAEKVKKDYLNTLHEATSIETGTWNLLKNYFPDEVVFTDGTKFTYIGVNKNLKLNQLDNMNFSRDPLTGYLSYAGVDGVRTSYTGIDVSTFQREINWEEVKAAGIEFAIIRCGFRGYGSEGKLVEDNRFRQHIEGALQAGLEVGVYFFTQAVTEEEAREEADYVLELIEGYTVSGPIIIDIEPVADKARTDGLTGEEITNNVAAFCDRIIEVGREPMIYSGLKYFIRIMDMEKLEPYEKWYAYYNDPLYFPYEITMWQYSMTGKVPGINGDVDLDILFDKWW